MSVSHARRIELDPRRDREVRAGRQGAECR